MLTRKDREFSWGPSQQRAFDSLKNRLSTAPVLAYPNFELPFILTTDASKVAVAAVLSQVQDGLERPLAYASRQMNTAEESYSASESEMLALVWATKYFRCYLYGRKFLVRKDHSALTYLRKFYVLGMTEGFDDCLIQLCNPWLWVSKARNMQGFAY